MPPVSHENVVDLVVAEIEIDGRRRAGVSTRRLRSRPAPSWDLAELLRHAGTVHRWAATMVERSSQERLGREDMDWAVPEDPARPPRLARRGRRLRRRPVPVGRPRRRRCGRGGGRRPPASGPDGCCTRPASTAPTPSSPSAGHRPSTPRSRPTASSELLDNLPHARYFAPRVAELKGSGESLAFVASDLGERLGGSRSSPTASRGPRQRCRRRRDVGNHGGRSAPHALRPSLGDGEVTGDRHSSSAGWRTRRSEPHGQNRRSPLGPGPPNPPHIARDRRDWRYRVRRVPREWQLVLAGGPQHGDGVRQQDPRRRRGPTVRLPWRARPRRRRVRVPHPSPGGVLGARLARPRGRCDARFLRPVYDGGAVAVVAAGDGGLELSDDRARCAAAGHAAGRRRRRPRRCRTPPWPAVDERADPPPAAPEMLVPGLRSGSQPARLPRRPRRRVPRRRPRDPCRSTSTRAWPIPVAAPRRQLRAVEERPPRSVDPRRVGRPALRSRARRRRRLGHARW